MSQPSVLKLNMSGQPLAWLSWQEAVTAYCLGRVHWTYGDPIIKVRGGISALTRSQSIMRVHGVIACSGNEKYRPYAIPPLTNKTLFRRDANLCMYCGKKYSDKELTRDHIHPVSKGGKDEWNNVVASCKRCNNRKGACLLSDSTMELLAVPYTPNHAEYLAMINGRRILADQMLFLENQFSDNCRFIV